MLSQRNGYQAIAAFTLLLGIAYIAMDRLAPAGRRLVKIGGVDTVLYFDTARSLLFDHDFNLNNEFTRVKPDAPRKIMPVSGLPSSCYAIGYSLLEVPFLAAGTLVDAVAHRPADGYSGFGLYFYCLASILLTGAGLLFVFKMLCEAAPSLGLQSAQTPAYSLFIAFAVFFGTNVGYYSFTHTSHPATFLFATAFMYCWWRTKSSNDIRRWLVLGLVGGFLSICRWQDGIFLGAPLLFDLIAREPWKKALPWLRARLVYIAGILVCWLPQLFEWKVIYGKYLTYPYSPNYFVDNSYEIGLMKFSFPPPYVWRVLMSSRNGWFVWTPLIALGVAGLIYGAAKSFSLFAPWIAVLAIELFLIGSVNGWHGTDSFGSRLLMSTIPIVALGLLAILAAASRLLRAAMTAAIVLCCIYTSLFAIQFRLDLIPSNETLTASELFTDKLHLIRVLNQKKAARHATGLLRDGDTGEAIKVLHRADSLGEDRDVLKTLVTAYQASGNKAAAEDADLRRKRYLDTLLN